MIGKFFLIVQVVVTGFVLFFILVHPALAEGDDWAELRNEIFGQRPIIKTTEKISLFAPASAKDAATVPISMRLSSQIVKKSKSLHLIIDRNPVPIAAEFVFSDQFRQGANIGERQIITRVRVDSFSKVRIILETIDGHLFMDETFVAGAGGCSAPSSKDPEDALTDLGEMKLKVRTSSGHGKNWREGIVMIKHPNFSGMQMNPETGRIVAAWFITDLDIKVSGQLMFKARTGISLSENPVIRFTYGSGNKNEDRLTVTAIDSKNNKFTHSNKISAF